MKEDEDILLPTASLDVIVTTLVIDVHDNRDIVIANINGAYLHAEMPKGKKVILKLKGVFVDIMCNINPEYKKMSSMKVKTKFYM